MRRSRIIVAITVAASALVLVATGAVTYSGAKSLSASGQALARSKDRSLAIEHTLTLLRDAETGQRGFLLTGREQYLEPYARASAELPQTLANLRRLYVTEPAQLGTIERIATLGRLKNAELARTIALKRAGASDQALQIVLTDQGKRTMDAIRTLAADLQAQESLALAQALRSEQRASLTATASVAATTVVSIAILAVLLYVLRRDASRVRASEERLATTLRSIGDAVIATTPDGHIELMNNVAADMTGWQHREATGRPLDEVFRIVNEQSREPVESPVVKVLREGTVVGLANHTLLLARDGREIPIEDSAAPIAERAGGDIEGVVLVFRDATEAREAANALREADRRKDEFLAVLAHELRNPLAPIRQAATIARSPSATPAQLAWCQSVIDRQVGHMARLLDDLLDVSRITRSKLEIRKSRVELSTIIDAAIEIARPLIDSRRHAFSVAVPAQPIFVDVDSLRLAQVVGNLLTNAAKYTHTDGRLSLRAQLAEDRVEIRVTDNGLGLRPEDLSRVFEMFVQIGSPPTEGGLGIGLALAKGVTELHGGTIEARSDGPGKGSEFIVRLPAATPIHSALASTPAVTAVDHRRSLRIVVADDNRDAAATLATLLELDGHQVEVAHSGDQALNLIEALRPDIALLDIGMPMLDGYAVARRVRAMAWSTRIKLVAVTGWGQAHDRERAQRAGFDQHWVKPIEAGALLALCASMDAHPPIGANA